MGGKGGGRGDWGALDLIQAGCTRFRRCVSLLFYVLLRDMCYVGYVVHVVHVVRSVYIGGSLGW